MSIRGGRSRKGKEGIFDEVRELVDTVGGGRVGVPDKWKGSSGATECEVGKLGSCEVVLELGMRYKVRKGVKSNEC